MFDVAAETNHREAKHVWRRHGSFFSFQQILFNTYKKIKKLIKMPVVGGL